MGYETHLPEEEPYLVHNLKEIIQILSDLSKRKTTIKASFNRGDDEYLTTIIEVDEQNHAVYLDIGLDETFNNKLLQSSHVVFLRDDGVRIKWVSEQISVVNKVDGKAIKIALPIRLVRMQRRDFFRVPTPVLNAVPCQIPIPNEVSSDANRTLELTLVDVSLGGVGVMATDPLHPALVEGASFDSCKISFPDVGMANLTLQVKNIMPVPVKSGSIKYRIGLQYIEPSRGNESLIHKYTFNLERSTLASAHNPDITNKNKK
jgi:c-di-GMP-binding flagellar brake protein YcgR